MILTQIPLPTVQNDVDIFWPSMTTIHNVGDAFDVNGAARYSGAPVAGLFNAKVGAGTTNMALDTRGRFVGQITSIGGIAAYTLGGFNIRPPLIRGGPTLFRYPSWIRVWRFQIVFDLQVVVVPSGLLLTMVGFQNNGAGGPGAAGNAYAGLSLDVDGRWKWVSRNGGIGFGLSEGPLDVGMAGLTTPAIVDFVWLAATDALDATFQLYVNGSYSAPVLTRSWGLTTVLPGYGSAAAPVGTAFNPFLQSNDAVVPTNLRVSYIRCSSGLFNSVGLPVV